MWTDGPTPEASSPIPPASTRSARIAQPLEADLEGYGAQGLDLLDGEGVERVLPLDSAADGAAFPPLLLLTDKRVIYVSGQGKRRRAMYASVGDVQAVEIGYHARGNSAYVWAGLALLAAFFLFFVIENTLGRIAGPVVVAGLGVYLVVDNLLTRNKQFVVFRAAGCQLLVDLVGDGATDAVDEFIGRLFQLKEGPPRTPEFAWVDRFAPR